MSEPTLTRYQSHGVALLGDVSVPQGVAFAFTERTGGVSSGCYSSLNLGCACGDDPSCVAENRRRALVALGAEAYGDALVNPCQVHGDRVVCVRSSDADAVRAAQRNAAGGADSIVCTVPKVPVLLCFADCVPVVLVSPGGFAVVHSGWRGTIARISAKAARVLSEETGVAVSEVLAYVGPHIGCGDYEVSPELGARFSAEFGPGVIAGGRNLDLGCAVTAALVDAGVPSSSVVVCDVSTASATERFFSYRAEHGSCGRHGALAVMVGE
ncbi:polyphenol oxidase family protein [Olsenella sp. Marseille-P4559]|uniref:polyphenol oxidase family protein n=1 Tax=Olsenella sp. Marseille-P4559 TaxID=2364795 RepID=UPI001031C0BD|nr:polyphenol oxidase family protein [Olsenella sp. Marseille-P4559]